MSNSGRLLIVGGLLAGVAFWAQRQSARELAAELGASARAAQPDQATGEGVLQQSAAGDAADDTRGRPRLGFAAPEMSALTIDGTEVQRTLRNYPGQVVVLYVWATWCGYCRIEMPEIEALHREFRGQGVHILAVAEDGDDESLRATARERGLTFDILRDDGRTTRRAYAVRGYPMTVIIDRGGVIRRTSYGYGPDNHQKNVAMIRKLLAE